MLQFTEHETPDDLDFFKFRAKAGQILMVETLTGRLDTLVGLFDSAGNLLAIDDDSGDGVLSRLAIIAPADGDYIVGVTQWPDFGFTGAGSGQTGRYVLGVQALTGTLLPVGDDSAAPVTFGFNFPFQGTHLDERLRQRERQPDVRLRQRGLQRIRGGVPERPAPHRGALGRSRIRATDSSS